MDDALERLAVRRNKEALKLYREKDYPGALAVFQQAYKLDPDNPEICNNLAFLYQLLGNYDAAERYYRRTLKLDPDRFVAYLNLVDLLAMQADTPQRLAEASGLLTKARELKGNAPDLILRQARIAVRSGRFEKAERFYNEYFETEVVSDELRVEVGDFYRDFAKYNEALSWYRQVDENGDYGSEAARRIWEIDVEMQARRFGWIKASSEIPAKAQKLVAHGRTLINRNQYVEAEKLLREAIGMAPQFAEAHADLGDILHKTGRAKEAELSYLRALAHDNGNAEFQARLGDLYEEGSLGDHSAEAVLFYEKALQLKPDWASLHIKLAAAQKAIGNFRQALWHIEKYLAQAPEDGDRPRALAMKENIEALWPEKDSDASDDPARYPVATDHALLDTLGRVRALLTRGELDEAMARLARLPDGDQNTEVLNLKARILQSAGRLDEAAAALENSLQIDSAQGDVYTQLGRILMDSGDYENARRRLIFAESLGDENALYHLARLDCLILGSQKLTWLKDWGRLGDLLRARRRLDSYLSQSRETRLIQASHHLKNQINGRLRAVYSQIVALGAVAALAALIWYRRRYGGIDLKTLITRRPESGPDVQRILSAIRHEVLKHNTMALTGLIETIRAGNPAQDKATHIAASLFGRDGKDAIVDKLRDYADRLERVGNAYSQRLNLARRDEGLAAIFKGFGILEKWAGDFNRIDTLKPARREKFLYAVEEATSLMNTHGYEAVRALLDQLRVLDVDEDILRGIHRKTMREPAFKGADFSDPVIDISAREPRGILMPRQVFEDVASNLTRNAAAASLKDGLKTVHIAFEVKDDLDDITGVERIALIVKDRSEQVLDPAMLRDRSVEEGLGLTAALVARYDGIIEVVPGEEPWTKGIAVKLPRAPMAETVSENA